MSKIKLRILSQLEENYGFHEGNYHWKPKGGMEFTINVDEGLLMYGDDRIIKRSIRYLLDKQSNDLERFTYISHELEFHKPIELEGSLEKVYEQLQEELEIIN